MVQLENVKKTFSDKLLFEISSLSLDMGFTCLTGASGCGKTTTGRSIIKLYDITGGNVYFRDRRICAGTLDYKEAIKKAKSDCELQIDLLKDEYKNNPTSEELKDRINKLISDRDTIIAEQKTLMAEAIHDHKHGDSIYAAELVKQLDDEYLPELEALKDSNPELYKETLKKYRHERRVAKHSRFITRIQMIFQETEK